MHPPSRTRRILKWTLIGLRLLFVIAWGVSLWLDVFTNVGRKINLEISSGSVILGGVDKAPILPGIRTHSWRGFGCERPRTYNSFHNNFVDLVIPFWLLLLISAIPTAWLWRRDRHRIPPGHCPRCGYDLTGNTSGVCSECGEPRAAGESIGQSGK